MGLFGRKSRQPAPTLPFRPPNIQIPPFTPTLVDAETILGMGPADLWRTQPYLRTVVTFMARNIAQLGMQAFRRVSDTDRQRLSDHPVALLFSKPNPTTTTYELLYQLVSDLAIYDRAYLYWTVDAQSESGYRLTRVPPSWIVGIEGGDLFSPAAFLAAPRNVSYLSATRQVSLPAEQVLYFHGWHPDDPRLGSSPVEALKQILAEQVHASAYRRQVWMNGGRPSAAILRPAEAPKWSEGAKERFKLDWQQKYAGDRGTEGGGTPILEDGMTLNKIGFSAHEDEFVDAAKLAINVVASVYHINPTMIGILDNANYSNVREFRRMLYGDTLGPVIAQIVDRINTFLVPVLPDPADVYVEFNLAEKLQGSFEEQALALQTAIGRPWMVPNEGRARFNMPALGGDADELTTPLNVAVGGQASPTDSGTQNVTPEPTKPVQAALTAFLTRQEQSIRSRLGGKSESWWDALRWDAELARDAQISNDAAHAINAVTHQRIVSALDSGMPPADAVTHAFEGRALALAA